MESDSASSGNAEIATWLVGLKREELDRFFREHLHRRDLHRVVANLNASALAKDDPNSEDARKALKRLGFPD